MINHGGLRLTYDAYHLETGFTVTTADDRAITRLLVSLHLPRDCSHYRVSVRCDMPSDVRIFYDRETTGVHADVTVPTHCSEPDGTLKDTPGESITVICDTGINEMLSGQTERISLMTI